MAPNQEIREIILKANAMPSLSELMLKHLQENADIEVVEDVLRLLGTLFDEHMF